jgi:serine protease Do
MRVERLIRFGLLVGMLIIECTSMSSAESLKLNHNNYWIVLASRQTLDEAIGFARRYQYQHARVVTAANGWFAVITGPQTIQDGAGPERLKGMINSEQLPGDSFLSSGDGFGDVVWNTPPSPVIQKLEYDGRIDATLIDGDLRVVISRAHAKDAGLWLPTATGSVNGQKAFEIRLPDDTNGSDAPSAEIREIRLDAGTNHPQVVFTYYWQGAHCCTVTEIASELEPNHWKVVEGDTLDGDGYTFETVDGSGSAALFSVDQAFLYAFDSYAGSNAPTRIRKLEGSNLIDMTTDAQFHRRLLQDFYGMLPRSDSDDAWHSNGFLAGWVASSILVGQGAEAWSKMLANFDHNSDFGPEKCLVDVPIANCPEGKSVRIPFPIALKEFLIEHGYINNASDYTVPGDIVSTPTATDVPPKMDECLNGQDTVRTLILQAFLSRRLARGESYNVVTLRDDTTVEAVDSVTNRVTCAVTYDMNLKALVGGLAENGYMQRANALSLLARRSGSQISNRVRYSVKPTARAGQTFIELLP